VTVKELAAWHLLDAEIITQHKAEMERRNDRDFLYPGLSDVADRLCCTNPVKDSSCESSVIAVVDEQTEHTNLQDPELARV
jgi:hypothetical protein